MSRFESLKPNPNFLPSLPTNHSSSSPQPPPPPPTTAATNGGGLLSIPWRPPLRVTTEFDSNTALFLHKISCKLFDSLAKLKLSFQNNSKGEVSEPQISFTSKNLSIEYDFEEKDTFITSSLDISPRLQLRAEHDVQAQQGEVSMVADLAGPDYQLELTSTVPVIGLPTATFRFPFGEVSLEEVEEDEEDENARRKLSLNGILAGPVFDGICTAQYSDENLNLKYVYKDEEMTFIPSISLPSNEISFAFKRQFGPSDKLSYLYNFESNYWSAVYKHIIGDEYKLKAGYDSKTRLGWTSVWVGGENDSTKEAPMKTKFQLMLQVPQDNIRSPALMFRVKKRWDV